MVPAVLHKGIDKQTAAHLVDECLAALFALPLEKEKNIADYGH